jgi:hypothetical protein
MADDKIVHRISLEGADDVAKKLKNIGDTGSDAFKKVKQYTDDSASGIGKAGTAFAALEGKTEGGRLASERFREAIHTLHPVLETAGLGLGNLGAFARVAGAGMGALGAAIAGSVIVGLAKLGDEALVAKKRLSDLQQNRQGGNSLFEGLDKEAQKLGTDVSNLLPGIENLIALRNQLNANGNVITAPGHAPFASQFGDLSNDKLKAAAKSLFAELLAGNATTDAATKAWTAFTAELQNAGQLTPAAVKAIASASPGAANALAQSLQKGFGNYDDLLKSLSKGTKISADEVIRDLARIGPEAEKALAINPKTFDASLDHLTSSFKSFFKSVEGDGALLSRVIDRIGDGLDKLHDRAEANRSKSPTAVPPTSPFGRLLSALGIDNPQETPNARVGKEFDALGKPDTGAAPGNRRPALEPFNPHNIENPEITDQSAVQPTGAAPSPQRDRFGQIVNPRTAEERAAYAAEERAQAAREGATIIPTHPPRLDFGDGRNGIFDQGPFSKNPNDTFEGGKLRQSSDGKRTWNNGYFDTPNGRIYDPNYDDDPRGNKVRPLWHDDPVKPDRAAGGFREPGAAGWVNGDPKPYKEHYYDFSKDPNYGPITGGSRIPPPIPGDPAGIRVRPIQEDQRSDADDAVQSGLSSLAQALSDAVDKIRSKDAGSPVAHAASGGHITGPGTSTSDSIPARLSDGEYVLNAKAVQNVGVDKLDAVNSGAAHFAEGGLAATGNGPIGFDRNNKAIYGELTGSAEVTYDPDSGGAYINGNLYPPGSPILDDPRIKAAIEKSKASMDAQQSYSGPSEYGGAGGYSHGAGGYASGGLVGNGGSRSGSFIDRLNAIGLASGGYIDVPSLAVPSGMPESAPMLNESSSVFSKDRLNMELGLLHPVTLNMPGGGSIGDFYAKPSAVAEMTRAAVDAQTFSTGKKPAWYGSGA